MKKLLLTLIAGAFVISACATSEEAVYVDTNKQETQVEHHKHHKKMGSASDSKLGK